MMDISRVIIIISSLILFLVLYQFRKFILFEIFVLITILSHGIYLFGPDIIYLLLITYVISTVAELVSLKTPLNCFSVKYRYNTAHRFFASKVNLFGVYPLEISFAWVILNYISFSLGVFISTAFSLPKIFEVALIPLILVSLDLIIDPVSVSEKKLWSWKKGSKYFGIPLRNFLGWYMVGLITMILFSLTGKNKHISFSYFDILSLIFYAAFLINIPSLYKKNRLMAIFGSVPAMMWIVISTVSLFVLWHR